MSHQANHTHLVLGLGGGAVRHDLLDGDHAAVMTTNEGSLQTVGQSQGTHVQTEQAGGTISSASSVKFLWGKLEVRSHCAPPSPPPPAA